MKKRIGLQRISECFFHDGKEYLLKGLSIGK
jgi:hypothetical protein